MENYRRTREKRLAFDVTESERESLDEKVSSYGLTRADFFCLLSGYRPVMRPEDLGALSMELRKILNFLQTANVGSERAARLSLARLRLGAESVHAALRRYIKEKNT
ncbi:MAG: hypothetical protein LUD29_06370 [Clostridia bacterium]|nr:hypothetical protein [Clostridia bacterium]